MEDSARPLPSVGLRVASNLDEPITFSFSQQILVPFLAYHAISHTWQHNKFSCQSANITVLASRRLYAKSAGAPQTTVSPGPAVLLFALFNLDDFVGDEAVGFAVDGFSGFLTGSLTQAEDSSIGFVEPVFQVFHPRAVQF